MIVKVKSFIGFFISLISILGINFIPLEMFLYRDFSGESAMVFYALENLVAVIFAAVFIAVFAPEQEENPDYARRLELASTTAFPIKKLRRKKEILQTFLVFSAGFSAGTSFFLLSFIILILKTEIQAAEIADVFVWVICLQIAEIAGIYITVQTLTLAKAELFLKAAMSRVAVLFLAVFIGIFFAFFVDRWFIVPFVILKTLVDLAEILRLFRQFYTAF